MNYNNRKILLVVDDSTLIKNKIEFLVKYLKELGSKIYILCRNYDTFKSIESEQVEICGLKQNIFNYGDNLENNEFNNILKKIKIEHLANYVKLNSGKYFQVEILGSKPYYETYSRSPILQLEFIYNIIKEIVKNKKITNMIILNGMSLTGFASLLGAIKYDIPNIFWENGLIKNSLILDTQGTNFFSKLSDNYINEKIKLGRLTKVNAPDKDFFSILKKRKKILICLQLDSDTNIICNSPFVNTYHFLNVVIENILEFSDGLFTLRIHPKTRNIEAIKSWIKAKKKEDRIKLDMAKNKVEKAIEENDLIITINSTVGFESICKKKDVIFFGETTFTNLLPNYTCNINSQKISYKYFNFNFSEEAYNLILKSLQNNSIIIDKKFSKENKYLIEKIIDNRDLPFILKNHNYPEKIKFKVKNVNSPPRLFNLILGSLNKKFKIIFSIFK
tara:strand:+ start:4840 stop:6180 length:1341 start_codon:yes stop_codon:yes gene_type:complete